MMMFIPKRIPGQGEADADADADADFIMTLLPVMR